MLWSNQLHGLAGHALGQGSSQQVAPLMLPINDRGRLHRQKRQSSFVSNGTSQTFEFTIFFCQAMTYGKGKQIDDVAMRKFQIHSLFKKNSKKL